MIDGATLSLVVSADQEGLLVCHRPSDLFVTLTRLCQSVVLARSSPLQKALVVMLVKKYEPSAITLAIGDGANDVSMIRAAHVGIGVAGDKTMTSTVNYFTLTPPVLPPPALQVKRACKRYARPITRFKSFAISSGSSCTTVDSHTCGSPR